VSVVRFKFRCNILISGKIIKDMLGSVASGTPFIKNQQDATFAVLFISNCKSTLHVPDAFCVHHQEY